MVRPTVQIVREYVPPGTAGLVLYGKWVIDVGVAMGGHTSQPKYENSCVLSNACGECRMGVAAMDPVNERRGAGAGYGATGRLPGVQRMSTKVSNRRRFPAMSPLSHPLQAGRCVNSAGVWASTWRSTTMGKRLHNGLQWAG
jgi:hypothetical protein